MKKILLLASFVFTNLLVSCGSDDENSPQVQNNAPSQPIVIVENQDVNFVTLKWDASTDKDGDKVVYDVILGNEIISNSQEDITFTYETANVTYPLVFKVVAKDGKSDGNVTSEVITVQEINVAPTKPTIEIIEELPNSKISLKWNASTDVNDDKVTYNVFLNDKLISENQTDTNFNFTDFTDVTYPLVFKIIATDGKKETESNIIEIIDPIIGNWILKKSQQGNEIYEVIECQDKVSIEFQLNAKVILETYIKDASGNCTVQDRTDNEASWKYENGKYKLIIPNEKYELSFENKNTLIIVFKGTQTDEILTYERL